MEKLAEMLVNDIEKTAAVKQANLQALAAKALKIGVPVSALLAWLQYNQSPEFRRAADSYMDPVGHKLQDWTGSEFYDKGKIYSKGVYGAGSDILPAIPAGYRLKQLENMRSDGVLGDAAKALAAAPDVATLAKGQLMLEGLRAAPLEALYARGMASHAVDRVGDGVSTAKDMAGQAYDRASEAVDSGYNKLKDWWNK